MHRNRHFDEAIGFSKEGEDRFGSGEGEGRSRPRRGPTVARVRESRCEHTL